MKKVLLTIKNFIEAPFVFTITVFWWKRNLEGVSFFRLQAIILTAFYGCKHLFGREIIIQQIKVASFCFYVDYLIDEKKEFTDAETFIHLPKISGLVDDIAKSHAQSFYVELRHLLDNDIRAKNARNYQEYLRCSRVSIGLSLLVRSIQMRENCDYQESILNKASEAIRIMSDLATFEKDTQSDGNNALNYKKRDELLSEVDESTKYIKSTKHYSELDQYIIRVLKLSLKLYLKKDFTI